MRWLRGRFRRRYVRAVFELPTGDVVRADLLVRVTAERDARLCFVIPGSEESYVVPGSEFTIEVSA